MAIDTETMQLIERIVARSVANATSLKGAADEITKGVTQYVGARYVPLFAEPLEWDKTKAYEPLTIVLYQGNSYTSRQYVPVGVELTNESFWAETGNYNAQVEQYRQEVKSFDGRITANANAIETETTNRTAAVAAEKTRAEGEEQTLQENIDAEKTRAEGEEQKLGTKLNFEISKTMDRKILWIGDSFSSDLHDNKNGNWSPVGFLKRVYKMNIVNMAVDGAGFAMGETFMTQAQSATDKESYTDVVVYGGDNDLYATSITDVINAIKEFWEYCISNFPNANFWLFACNTPIKSNFQLIYNYLYYSQSKSPRIKVFTNVNAVTLATNTTQATTNEHPTELGGKFLADYFYKALNGSTPTLAQLHKGVKLSENFTVNDNLTYECVANLTGVYFPTITITLTNDISGATPIFRVPIWLSKDNSGHSRYIYNFDGTKNHNVGYEQKTEETVIWNGSKANKGYTQISLFGNFNSGDVLTIPGIAIPFTNNSII